MKKRDLKIISVCVAFLFSAKGFSQTVSISKNAIAADTTALLDISSTEKGLLIPRMTAQQKNVIANPANGLLIFQTDGEPGFYYFNGNGWFLLVNNAATDRQKTLIYTAQGF